MKLDYGFIKEILLAMEKFEEHEIRCPQLVEILGGSQTDINFVNKFVGHIKILGDNHFIDCSTKDYGVIRYANGGYSLVNPIYRITAQGYDFLDMLKNDTVFNKVKDFTLSNAVTIGREIIIRSAVESIKTMTGQNFPSGMC